MIGGSLEAHRHATLERLYDAFTSLLLYEQGYDAVAGRRGRRGRHRQDGHVQPPSKDALLVAYVVRESEVYFQHLSDALARVDNPVDRLRAYVAEQLRYFASHHMPPGSALKMFSKVAYERVADHVVALEQVLEIIADAVDERYVAVDDVEATIPLVVSCIHRAGTDEQATVDLDAALRNTESFALRALGVHHGTMCRPRRHPAAGDPLDPPLARRPGRTGSTSGAPVPGWATTFDVVLVDVAEQVGLQHLGRRPVGDDPAGPQDGDGRLAAARPRSWRTTARRRPGRPGGGRHRAGPPGGAGRGRPWLVEGRISWVDPGQDPGQGDLGPLAARELAEGAVGEGGGLGPGHRRRHDGARPSRPPGPQPRGPAHLHDLGDGEREGDVDGLGEHGPAPGQLGRRPVAAGPAARCLDDAWRRGRRRRSRTAQQRRLPGAVGADQGQDLAGPGLDGDVVEDDPAAQQTR